MVGRVRFAAVPRLLAGVLLALLAHAATAATLAVTVVDATGKPVADAVVAVTVKGARTVAQPGATGEIAQKNRQFQPGVTVVQTGTAVHFPNLDTTRHHVYSFSPIRRFELKLYSGTPAAPVVFDKAGVAVLGCNIHDKMRAWVVVVDTPYFAKTDAQGRATLDVPAGEHLLRVWFRGLAEDAPWPEQPVQPGANDAVRVIVTGADPS